MEESFYHEIANLQMSKLLEYTQKLEESYDIEAELDSGVLTIVLPNRRQYVINKHTPSRQIWVSSPISGAGYYEFKNQEWLPKRSTAGNEANLQGFLQAELEDLL